MIETAVKITPMRCLFKGNSQWQVDLMLVTVGFLIDVLYDIQRRKEKRIGLKTFKKRIGEGKHETS